MSDQKPTAEATRVAEERLLQVMGDTMASDYPATFSGLVQLLSGAYQEQLIIQERSATLITAKDAEISNLKEAYNDTIEVLEEVRTERNTLREQNQQHRALLVEAHSLLQNIQAEIKLQIVREKLSQCEAGRVLWTAKSEMLQRWLSTPAVVELLKETQKPVNRNISKPND